ncbi:pyocin knob domain-containing protein, partial [Lactococcus lactis]
FLAAAQVANYAFKMPAASTGEQTIYTIAAQISVSNTATVSLTVDPDSIVTNAGLKVVTDAQAVKDSAQDVKISSLETKDAQNVKTTGNQTIGGIKTFTEKIIGSITGTADKAVALFTGRKLKVKLDSTTDKTFNGTADVTDIGVSGVLQIANGGTGNNLGLSVGQSLKGVLSNADDLNNCKSIGKWTVGGNKPANSPTNGDPYAIVTVESSENSSGFIIQTYKDILNKVFIRTLAGSSAVWGAWIQLSDDSTVVHNTGDQTIAGAKTFTQKITGSISGNAEKAVALVTSRKLKVKLDSTTDKTFNGTADVTDIGVSGVLQIANGGTGVSDGTVNTTAWSNSADGTDRFTMVYPNLNLLDGTRDFSGTWTNSSFWTTDGTYKGLTVKKTTGKWNGIYKTFTAPKDGIYTFSAYIKSSGNMTNVNRFGGINSTSNEHTLSKLIGNNFDWTMDTVTANLKANDSVWIKYEITGNGTDLILWTAGHKWEQGSTATPYMPSSTEVTSADWPSYIGYSNTLKLGKGPTDFTWTQVFTEKSVVPITNGGTGNANGLAVGQSSGAQLRYFDDLNDIATTIQYTLNGETPINAPTDAKSNFGFVIVQTRDDSGSGFAVQRYITTANEEFIRSKIGDPHYYWTDWKQL